MFFFQQNLLEFAQHAIFDDILDENHNIGDELVHDEVDWL